jgi:hypothetical protein
MRRPWIAVALFPLVLLLGGCHPDKPIFRAQILAFGTLVELSIFGASRERAQAAADAIEADFQQMHRSWQAWDPGPLGRVNRLLVDSKGILHMNPAMQRRLQLLDAGLEIQVSPPLTGGTGPT